MIVLPILALLFSLACAAISAWDAVRRPKPERVIWTIAFIVFAVAAASEVAGSQFGWTPSLARIYYLAGAVLVVGLLGLGELYLLFGAKMPTIVPGVTILVGALAATLVWGAPVDESRLASAGWSAIEKGPALVALAASMNILGTLVLCAGALWSAWKLRTSPATVNRALGCALIAVGAIIVAMGGTLTRLGQREYLYLAMTIGIAAIFAGMLQTRRAPRFITAPSYRIHGTGVSGDAEPRLTLLRPVAAESARTRQGTEAVDYVVDELLPLDESDLGQKVRDWGATGELGLPLSRMQAARVWMLRCDLPAQERPTFDRLPLHLQAQVAELYAEIWTDPRLNVSDVQPA
jgi:hypothetical protein